MQRLHHSNMKGWIMVESMVQSVCRCHCRLRALVYFHKPKASMSILLDNSVVHTVLLNIIMFPVNIIQSRYTRDNPRSRIIHSVQPVDVLTVITRITGHNHRHQSPSVRWLRNSLRVNNTTTTTTPCSTSSIHLCPSPPTPISGFYQEDFLSVSCALNPTVLIDLNGEPARTQKT